VRTEVLDLEIAPLIAKTFVALTVASPDTLRDPRTRRGPQAVECGLQAPPTVMLCDGADCGIEVVATVTPSITAYVPSTDTTVMELVSLGCNVDLIDCSTRALPCAQLLASSWLMMMLRMIPLLSSVRFLIWLTALNVMGSMVLPAAQVNSMLPRTAMPRFGGGEKVRVDMTAELLAMRRSDPLTAKRPENATAVNRAWF